MADSILNAGQVLYLPEPIAIAGHAFHASDGVPTITIAGKYFLPPGDSLLQEVLAHGAAHHEGYKHRQDDPLAPTSTEDLENLCG